MYDYELNQEPFKISDDIVKNRTWDDKVLEFKVSTDFKLIISNKSLRVLDGEKTVYIIDFIPLSYIEYKVIKETQRILLRNNKDSFIKQRVRSYSWEYENPQCLYTFEKFDDLIECAKMLNYINLTRIYDLRLALKNYCAKAVDIIRDKTIKQRLLNEGNMLSVKRVLDSSASLTFYTSCFFSCTAYDGFDFHAITSSGEWMHSIFYCTEFRSVTYSSLFSWLKEFNYDKAMSICKSVGIQYNLNQYYSPILTYFLLLYSVIDYYYENIDKSKFPSIKKMPKRFYLHMTIILSLFYLI